MSKSEVRIVLLGKDIELRIVSAIQRCREIADDVIFIDLGSEDDTGLLAGEVGCKVLNHPPKPPKARTLAKLFAENEIEMAGKTLFLNISNEWRLRDLPLSANRLLEQWDVHFSIYLDEDEHDPEEMILKDAVVQHLVVTPSGMESLSNLSSQATALDIPEELTVRIVKASHAPKVPQRQSLATASKFAQLFYWMLESKHPLVLFGIPGITIFILGWRLSEKVNTFSDLNSTSLGVTLATIALTLIGLFAIMVALTLYIMGKQVKHIQAQYEGRLPNP